jgi:hypothetical protein
MIDRRLLALVLLLLAGGLYRGIASPARRTTAQLEAELLRVRAESEPLRRRLAEGEPQRAALDAWQKARPRGDRSLAGLRHDLLQSVEGAQVSGVRLSVVRATPPLAARAQVAALGAFADLLDLSERLVGPTTGVVPQRLSWAVSGSELTFELDGVVLGSR